MFSRDALNNHIDVGTTPWEYFGLACTFISQTELSYQEHVSINGFPKIGNICDLPNILVSAQNRTILNCTIIGKLFFSPTMCPTIQICQIKILIILLRVKKVQLVISKLSNSTYGNYSTNKKEENYNP